MHEAVKGHIRHGLQQIFTPPLTDQFMSSDHNPLDCGEFAAVPLQACTQVVAGLNYEVLVNITCADGGSIVVLGTAFVGLPVDGKQQIEVESAEEVSP